MRLLSRAGGAVAGAAALGLGGVTATPVTAAPAAYTVSVGSPVPFPYPTGTPASPFLDRDGIFHHQQSAALYGAGDPRSRDFSTGTDFDTAGFDGAPSTAVNPADPDDRTTARCTAPPPSRRSP